MQNLKKNVVNFLTVRSPIGSVTVNSGNSFKIYDDDDFNDSDGTNQDGDALPAPGENITRPDTYLLTADSDNVNTNVFAPAYVHPVYDIGNNNDFVGFSSNVLSDSAGDISSLFERDPTVPNADNNFWAVYILGAYQHTLGEDNDPESESCPDDPTTHCFTQGIVDEITDATHEGSGALIFTEIHRPAEIPGYTNNPTNVDSMANTVAHEVGHLFSGEHGELGLMGDADGYVLSSQFTPTTINKIRNLMHP